MRALSAVVRVGYVAMEERNAYPDNGGILARALLDPCLATGWGVYFTPERFVG
jgi:hypothetical protein